MFRRKDSLERQDEGSLLLGHLGFEAALVEGLAHGSDASARATPCDESSATLCETNVVSDILNLSPCGKIGSWLAQLAARTYEESSDGGAGSNSKYRCHDEIRVCIGDDFVKIVVKLCLW